MIYEVHKNKPLFRFIVDVFLYITHKKIFLKLNNLICSQITLDVCDPWGYSPYTILNITDVGSLKRHILPIKSKTVSDLPEDKDHMISVMGHYIKDSSAYMRYIETSGEPVRFKNVSGSDIYLNLIEKDPYHITIAACSEKGMPIMHGDIIMIHQISGIFFKYNRANGFIGISTNSRGRIKDQ